MQGSRFSLSTMLVGMLVVAIGSTAIAKDTSLWRWLFELLSMSLLLLAALYTFYCPREKPFWVGFFVFSVGRILLTRVAEYNMVRSVNLPRFITVDAFPHISAKNSDSPVVTAWIILFGVIGGCLAVFVHVTSGRKRSRTEDRDGE